MVRHTNLDCTLVGKEVAFPAPLRNAPRSTRLTQQDSEA
jgi:hypothetical protein